MRLNVQNLSFGYGRFPVLKGVSFNIVPGEIVCLVGPNGSGKSTLIRCIDSILQPQSGKILVNGEDSRRIPRQELARQMAYVPQGIQQAFPITVFDTVMMGRRPHSSWRSSESDVNKVIEVIQLLGLDDIAMKNCNELSGGQQQRVMIAMAWRRPIFFYSTKRPQLSISAINWSDGNVDRAGKGKRYQRRDGHPRFKYRLRYATG